MSNETSMETNINFAANHNGTTRRSFVKTASQVAVTAPAVSLLLTATTKPAAAGIAPYCACEFHILDDFTFGNTEEDIDAARFGNFNPLNGQQNQDDHVFIP